MNPAPPLDPAFTVTGLCSRLAEMLLHRNLKLATAESCTGGLIAAACTELSGSSGWFERGFVTYSNAAKTESLGVAAAVIERFGAVSEEVVRAMVQGAITHSHAQVAVAVTGVAGPTGGSKAKPVGTVWLGWSINGQLHTQLQLFGGERAAVRAATVRHALQHLLVLLQPAG